MKIKDLLYRHKLFLNVINQTLNYPFRNSKRAKTKYDTVSLNIDIPKFVDRDIDAIISLMQENYRDLDGYKLTKTKFIVSCVMEVLCQEATPAGRIKRNYELYGNDGLKYEISKRDFIELHTNLERKKQ